MEAFAQTRKRLECGEAVNPVESIGLKSQSELPRSQSELPSTLMPRRSEIIQALKHRRPTPIGDRAEPIEDYKPLAKAMLELWSIWVSVR